MFVHCLSRNFVRELSAIDWAFLNDATVARRLLSTVSTGSETTSNDSAASSNTATTAAPTPDNHYDVIVSGGGMVGFAMACAIGQSPRLSGLRVLVLEGGPHREAPLSWEGTAYSNRVSTLSHASTQLLDRLGAWPHMQARVKPVYNMQVWESESDAYISFRGTGGGPLAHVAENHVIVAALQRQLPPHVQVRYSCPAQSYSLPGSLEATAAVELGDGGVVTTDLIVGCDGAGSLVRRSMGSPPLAWDYNQSGVVATLAMDTSDGGDNSTAWQKFLPSGPIALLPLSSGLSSLVWSTSKSHAKALLAMTEEDFTDALNSALWSDSARQQPELLQRIHRSVTAVMRDLGRVVAQAWPAQEGRGTVSGDAGECKQLPPAVEGVVEESRAAFPLGLCHATHYVAPRVALVGDAAHRVHPLAGQGVNLGFGDVTELLRCLEDAAALGADLGSSSHLHNYETLRQRQNGAIMAGIDALHRLYGTDFPPAVLLRSLGLSAVDACTPLKDLFARQAEGSLPV